MDAAELDAALRDLADELRRRGVAGRLYLLGGAAMALAYDANRTTRDVDTLIVEGHGPVIQAAAVVAQRRGLTRSWLNEQATAYIPAGDPTRARVVFDAPGLTVLAATPRAMLAMKATAARTTDIGDLRVLAGLLDVHTLADVVAVVAEQLPDQPLSPRSRAVLAEVFDGD